MLIVHFFRNLLPFNPVPTPMHGAPMGLLPPPLPLPEPIRENSPKDRILDPSEFYTIQKELRRFVLTFSILYALN